MHGLWAGILNVFFWVAQASTYSVAAIIIISLAQFIGRRWMPANWSYALWLILLVRMALPFGLESRISLWNMAPPGTFSLIPAGSNPPIGLSDRNRVTPELLINPNVPDHRESIARNSQKGESKAVSIPWTQWRLISALWLAGALSLLAIIALSNLRLWRSVRKIRLVTAQPVIELFEDCKQLMKVRTVVGLVITDHVQSPALFGFVRPRVLLPAGLAGNISLEELRYIFLHELAHLKRGDIWIGWIVAALQSLHWFNPLVWWAFIRMRADRELACDALALSYLQDKDNRLYGGALINLLDKFSHSQHLPAIAGILENKTQLKRRLTMITQFSRPTRRASLMAAVLLLVLAAGLLTNAKDISDDSMSSAVWTPAPQQPVPAAPAVQKESQKLSLQFEGADLNDFINHIAPSLGLTPIIIHPNVKGKVTLSSPSPMSKDDVLPLFHMILKDNNAALIKQGDVYHIVPIAAAVKIGADAIE